MISSASGGGGGRVLGSLAAVGAIAALVSANVKPRADVRYWANLPETVLAATLQQHSPITKIDVALRDGAGQPVGDAAPRIHQWTDRRGNTLIWLKSRN